MVLFLAYIKPRCKYVILTYSSTFLAGYCNFTNLDLPGVKESYDCESMSIWYLTVLVGAIGSTIVGIFTYLNLKPSFVLNFISILQTLFTAAGLIIGLYGVDFVRE